MYSPFGMNTARRQAGLYSSPYQPQNQQQSPYDFKGLENRLGQIETGIAGLTDQFKNWDRAGQETVDPEYTGNNAPDPLTPAVPTGGISSLPEAETTTPDPVAPQGPPQPISMAEWVRNYEFDMAPKMDTNRWEFEKKYQEENPIDPIDFSDANRDLAPLHEQRTNMQQAWQKEQEAFRNTPEYQGWQQRNEARGDVSAETQEIMRGGQRFSSNGGNDIIPYIRGGGGGYEDYLTANENARKAGQIRQDWVAGGGKDQTELMDQLTAAGLATGIGGLPGQQQQQLSRQRSVFDPTKGFGGENYVPLTEEEYGRQSDLWGKHMDFRNFSQKAQSHLAGSGQGVGMRMGYNPAFGHAYEAWQQFNQGQEGGPYTDPNAPTGIPSLMNNNPFAPPPPQQGPQQPFTNTRGQNNPLSTSLGAGIGALTGPTQQKIQGYMT